MIIPRLAPLGSLAVALIVGMGIGWWNAPRPKVTEKVVQVVVKDQEQAEKDRATISGLEAKVKELRNATPVRACLNAGDTQRLRSLWSTAPSK